MRSEARKGCLGVDEVRVRGNADPNPNLRQLVRDHLRRVETIMRPAAAAVGCVALVRRPAVDERDRSVAG